MSILKDFLFVEKYRPKTVADTILPETLKKQFQQFVDQKNIPNLLLCGGAGVGKTTVAKAMLEELGCDYIVINGSLSAGVETLRNDIKNFASTMSLSGGRKYVILDEADGLNHIVQPALRNFLEEYSATCGFIFTANYKFKIIEPLWSRCSVIEFKIPPSEKASIAKQILKRCFYILDQEKIEYDKKAVAELIMKFYPDWRRVINELQAYSATGKIDSGILANLSDDNIINLINFLKEKNFTDTRKWIAENSDIEPVQLFDKIYDKSNQYLEKSSIPELILILAKYSYQSAHVAQQEINTAACMIEIMSSCQFK